MIKYYNDSINPDYFESVKEKGRGAVIYGNLICSEVANYYDYSASVSSRRDQLLSMFFAGTIKALDSEDIIDEDSLQC